MRQSSDVRVKTDAQYEQLYKDLRGFCGEAHSVFFLCACLGIRDGRPNRGAGRRTDRFFSGTIEPNEWACYYALAVRDAGMDFGVLDDDKSVLKNAEDYADRGMELLIDDLFGDYMKGGAEFQLDMRSARELSWELLKFIPDQLI